MHRPGLIGLLAAAVVAPCALPARATAQDLELVVPASGPADAAWATELGTALERGGRAARTDPEAALLAESARRGALDAARIDGLGEVAALLSSARADAVDLHEGRALARLARAALLAEAHPDVAGAAAWDAEVQTAIGIVAAQAGLPALSEGALARAATLDATRGVRAAEAPPDLVAQAAEIARRVATGPTGTFEVVADAPGARVLLDDADVGVAPRVVHAAVGRHVLRVEAPGRRPFGTMLDVFEGQAPPLHVALDEDPWLEEGRRLARAAEEDDTDALRTTLASLAREGVTVAAVWTVRASGDGARALVRRCDVQRCGRPWGVSRDGLPRRLAGERDLEDAGAVARADEAFLAPPRTVVPPPAQGFWDGPWPWLIAGAAVLAGSATAVGVAAQQAPPDMRIFTIHAPP